jgi:hypothetical protein
MFAEFDDLDFEATANIDPISLVAVARKFGIPQP